MSGEEEDRPARHAVGVPLVRAAGRPGAHAEHRGDGHLSRADILAYQWGRTEPLPGPAADGRGAGRLTAWWTQTVETWTAGRPSGQPHRARRARRRPGRPRVRGARAALPVLVRARRAADPDQRRARRARRHHARPRPPPSRRCAAAHDGGLRPPTSGPACAGTCSCRGCTSPPASASSPCCSGGPCPRWATARPPGIRAGRYGRGGRRARRRHGAAGVRRRPAGPRPDRADAHARRPRPGRAARCLLPAVAGPEGMLPGSRWAVNVVWGASLVLLSRWPASSSAPGSTGWCRPGSCAAQDQTMPRLSPFPWAAPFVMNTSP